MLKSGIIDERERLTKQRAQLQQKVDRAFYLAYDGRIDKATLVNQSNRIKEELDPVDKLLGAIPAQNNDWVDRENVIKYMEHSRDKLQDEDVSILRRIIQSYVEKVVVYKDRIGF